MSKTWWLSERGSAVLAALVLALIWFGMSLPQPAWGLPASLAVFAAVLGLQLLLPRCSLQLSAMLRLTVLLLMLCTAVISAVFEQFWLPWPALGLLLLGMLLQRLTRSKGALPVAGQLARAVQLREQGQLDQACDQLLRLPSQADVHAELMLLARACEEKGLRGRADQVFRHLARLAPDFPGLPAHAAGSFAAPLIPPRPTAANARQVLGRYQLQRELGKGAMGVVYQGTDSTIGRVVAIKTMALADEFEADMLDDARQRFFREAETAGRLAHPNIVTIFDAGEADGLAYIAMELLAGSTLEAHAAPGTLLPLADALAIVRQIALALEYAHKQQVVHRDIKPANVMYDPATRKVKVTDFGIARLTDANRTKTGLVLGTPSFMSPEQLAGQRIDGRSDLYSLGVLLYQLTTGHLPFNGNSLAELMYAIANLLPTDPRHYNRGLPNMLVAIIMKALQKDAGQRFQSGAQFALALARLEAQLKGKMNAESRPGT
ncbi:serine/threonine-protein kinase [Chitinilyticum aquatile]|uniref:serine/threonine-protein kinase n=1 Tax=Chitinilyticum aquatile TaxID=362520 RepID=UPI000410B88D|nr:serine/threonine-protein kinase [Chitinilyticum aquatile]